MLKVIEYASERIRVSLFNVFELTVLLNPYYVEVSNTHIPFVLHIKTIEGYSLSISTIGYGSKKYPFEIAIMHYGDIIYTCPVSLNDVTGWLTLKRVALRYVWLSVWAFIQPPDLDWWVS